MESLDQILSGDRPEAPPPASPPEPKEPAPPQDAPTEPEPSSPSGEPAEKPSSPPPGEGTDPEQVPVRALQDERRKRQELERRLAEYEAFARQQQQPEPPKRPDLFEDPDGALGHLEQQFQQQLVRTRLDMSVAMAKSQYEDYDQAEEAFVSAVKANPSLYQQMLADPHPAGFAYRVGRQVQALREIGSDPNAYRERMREQLRQELLKEMQAAEPTEAETPPPAPAPAPPRRPSAPPSLATARDTSGRFAPKWSGPPALTEIIGPRR